MTFKRLCVFCGARPGKRPEYTAAAQALGRTLAERGIELVYGGGNIGLMGVVADACMSAGGSAIGVIPEALLKWEVGHQALTRLEVVDSMHTRKARMAELSDGFIALPGGLGTFEELFEVLTWSQLGFHGKPIGLLNVANYYTPLVQMVDNGVDEGFMKPENAALLLRDDNIDGLLRQMAEYQAPEITRQIKNEKQL
ncbi:MAG: TIGR00730 family Rossman fold protein [Denitromonas halophila]|uniref:Cytokinin riboside 5'-monophosphate phosphoribohydrolase n=1 Tax=Denitromonas halophila TaxID=1629404 RepID=A0A558EL78_9RHOO|nr:TIGR00730 family Rossman fold protein [Denitromonas halophila]TVO57858.1 TIGR00730 family Rossman fold protein [Denitromonas halophila]TVT74062.1 MAG: TIGR00730 family Rossman fold protein [Denitromonas halophila]